MHLPEERVVLRVLDVAAEGLLNLEVHEQDFGGSRLLTGLALFLSLQRPDQHFASDLCEALHPRLL